MSYLSVNKHLEAQGATLEAASDARMASAFRAAFREDVPLGITRVDELAGKTKSTGQRAMVTLNPNSDEGKQFSRLLGADIARRVELRDGVSFGFYNCCKGLAAPTRDAPRDDASRADRSSTSQFCGLLSERC
jgi:hypothetical protein